MKSFILLALILAIAYSIDNDCHGQRNDNPLIDQEPVLLNQTKNGQLYLIQNGTSLVYIVNLTGSHYEMGYAYGQLMSTQISQNVQGMYQYLENEADTWLDQNLHLPKEIREKLISFAEGLLNMLLDLNYYISYIYTPPRFFEEIKGMADGAGLDIEPIRRINYFPELTQAACTMVGAWDKATSNGNIIQLRALDWASDAPVNRNPAIAIYHPTQEKGAHSFANIGFAGLIGALTAYGFNGVGVSEKVWYPAKSEGVKYTYFGKPWAFVLRDVAEFGTDLDQIIETLNKTHRTMKIHIGIGTTEDNAFRGIEYGENKLDIFDDKNYTAYSDKHPQMDGVMYWDKFVQPSNDGCVGSILKEQYGNVTVETLYRDIAGYHQTGDTQVCAFDNENGIIYLSYSEYQTNVKAYLRPIMKVNLKSFAGQSMQVQQESQ